MKQSIRLYVAVGLVSTICCTAVASDPVVKVHGAVGKRTRAGGYGFHDFTSSKIGNEPFRKKLNLTYEKLTTREVLKLRVEEEVNNISYNYNVLLGGLAHPARVAEGRVKKVDSGQGLPHEQSPAFQVDAGWALLWTNPETAVAITKWIIGATEGTTMVVEVVEDGSKERVYLLEGNNVRVTCLTDTNEYKDLREIDKFVVVTNEGGACKISDPKPIQGARKTFIDELKEIATAADWP